MTYEEAKMQIQAIPEKIWNQLSEPDNEAMEMVFSALQAQANESKTRNFLFTESGNESKERDIILRQDAIDLVEGLESARLKGEIDLLYPKVVKGLNRLPSAQSEIVRCKDCKYRGGLSGFYCDIVEKAVGVDSFCSWGEKKTDDNT